MKFFILSGIIIVPSFLLNVLYFLRDFNKRIIISTKYIKQIKGNDEICIQFEDIKEICRVSSEFEDSPGYGSLYFFGGSFYYYRISSSKDPVEIEGTCLMLDEWVFNKYNVIEQKVFFPV